MLSKLIKTINNGIATVKVVGRIKNLNKERLSNIKSKNELILDTKPLGIWGNLSHEKQIFKKLNIKFNKLSIIIC